jgi:hypothetical protein
MSKNYEYQRSQMSTFYEYIPTISGGSRKFFQGVQRSLQNLNITSLKKKIT